MKTTARASAMLAAMDRSHGHRRLLGLIERQLAEPLTLGELAAVSGLSPFHFSRLFTALHGESIMAYVRRRRLARAARRLIEDREVELVALALESGFESQQAFTRQYGVSPGRFRRPGLYPRYQPGDPTMSHPADIALDRVGALHPKRAFRAAGLKARFDRDSVHAIPALWDRLDPHLPIAGSRRGTLGLCVASKAGDFDYMAGVEMAEGAAAPEGLDLLEVPAQTYAVWRLTASGEALHPQMQAAVRDIWGRRLGAEGLKPSGGPDFELYPPYFTGRKAGETVEFWIPVEA